MTIQALPTKYKGYTFRSRLEARWAICFDALGVQWEYENEGFNLADVGYYLPDFHFPTWQMYAEIKPSVPVEGYWIKPAAFADKGQKKIIVICGNPWQGEYDMALYTEDVSLSGPWDEIEFMECRRCDGICLASDVYLIDVGDHTCEPHDKWPTVTPRILAAYTAARSATLEGDELIPS